VNITLNNGTVHHLFVKHAIGSIHKALTDAMLEAKFHGLVNPVQGKERAATAQCPRHPNPSPLRRKPLQYSKFGETSKLG
jgi:hypothetical protein